jgi:acetyl-CoA acyltransferase 2
MRGDLSRMKTQGKDVDVVFLSGVRTPFGSFGGTLKDVSAIDLAAEASRVAIERSGLKPADIDHSVFGNALQTSADAIYFARHVALKAGVPVETPALTVNRLCGSGFEAIAQGAQQIILGESRAVLCGGGESMSQAPHVLRGARWGLRLGPSAPLEDLLWESLKDPQCGFSMAETAENLADQYKLSRAEVDEYAARSQRNAKQAWDAGAFEDEIIPIPIKDRKTKQLVPFKADEHMRPETTVEALAKLPPYFKKDGLVTAGNASGICDGAAALVIASESFAKEKGAEPIGRLVAWATAGVEPRIMGIGPAPAIRKVMAKAGLSSFDKVDLIEVNEAFAPQYVAVEKELKLPREKTNAHGGAIAIGHPLAASGARITAHLLHALRRTGGKLGIGSACIGGGQGIAVVVEAFPKKGR